MVKVELIGLEFFAYHGVYSKEQQLGNNFVVNLSVIGDFDQAVENDKLEATINYETLYELVATEMQIPSNLLEHVAGRILDRIVNCHPEIKKVTVMIEKLNPPIEGKCKATRVTLSRRT